MPSNNYLYGHKHILLRNGEVFADRAAAVQEINSLHSQGVFSDGEIVTARYFHMDGNNTKVIRALLAECVTVDYVDSTTSIAVHENRMEFFDNTDEIFDNIEVIQGVQGTQGSIGAQGAQGTQGIKGDTGAQGAQGTQGIKGNTGAQGAQGTQGIKGGTGAQGAQGTQGIKGDTGAQGSVGAQGAKGTQGTAGTNGAQGSVGAQGAKGTQGTAGTNGAQGSVGAQGATGAQGAKGAQGNVGAQGATGAQGTAGTNGAQGSVGAQGAKGTQGTAGTNGAQGSVGAQGAKGAQGTAGTNGAQGSVGAQGAKGAQGTAGTNGAQGSVGAQGAKGAQGTAGTNGAQGSVGAQGAKGAQGTAGTNGAQGSVGAQGAKGTQGTAGTNGAQGSVGAQGAKGTQGTAGTNGAQGSVGAQGAKGDTGAQGAQGTQGIKGDTGAQGSVGAQGAKGTQGTAGTNGAQGAQGTQGIMGANNLDLVFQLGVQNNEVVITSASQTVSQVLTAISNGRKVTTTIIVEDSYYSNCDSVWCTVSGDEYFESFVPTWGEIFEIYGDLVNDWEFTNNEYKTKQTYIPSPTASGTATQFITTIEQNENGEIYATKSNVNVVDRKVEQTGTKPLDIALPVIFQFPDPGTKTDVVAIDIEYGSSRFSYNPNAGVLSAPYFKGDGRFLANIPTGSHTHGNIQNSGTLQTNDVTIATGDKLVITDSSDSDKIARSSLSFNTVHQDKFLRQDGTWQTIRIPQTTFKFDTLTNNQTAVTFADTPCYYDVAVTGATQTFNISIPAANEYTNYLLVKNTGSAECTIALAKASGMGWTKFVLPSNTITVASGKAIEISFVSDSTGAVLYITNSAELTIQTL